MICLLLGLSTAALAALPRTALVIGNSAYSDARLKNPVNDAADMAEELEDLGFEVILQTDIDQRQFEKALRKFKQRLQRRGGVGLFFYAGHGMQVQGENFLIPVGTDISGETDVRYEAVPAGKVLGYMEEANTALNIVILDACRDNPYERRFRNSARGLVRVKVPDGELGSFLAYSTRPGEVAADGTGRNSPFTARLKRIIKEPGLSLSQVFHKVRVAVYQETGGQQKPWVENGLLGDFSFVEGRSQGRLIVRSNVHEDSVYINGQYKGSTRLDLDLPPGNYRVRVTKEGYQDWEDRIDLQAGDEEVLRAKLVRSSKPSTASYSDVERPPVTKPQQKREWRDPVTGMEFVWVPEGCFQMGSTEGASDEKPLHEVCVDGFWMGKYEVTNKQYRRYKKGHDSKEYKGHSLNGDNQPAVAVSWEDAQAYAKWLSQKGNGRYRLPTEAEWEYAARAGTRTERYWGDDPDKACRYDNVADQSAKQEWSSWTIHDCDDGYKVTAPVGSFQANAFGFYDLLGNVWEWVSDWYSEDYYRNSPKNNPQGPSAGASRVRRGGGWCYDPAFVRAAIRFIPSPGGRDDRLGFRLLRTNP